MKKIIRLTESDLTRIVKRVIKETFDLDSEKYGGKCFGPEKNIVQAKFGKITEYFITYTI